MPTTNSIMAAKMSIGRFDSHLLHCVCASDVRNQAYVVSIRRCSSDVRSEQLHFAVHAEDAVVLQVLVVGRDGCL